MRSLSSQQTAGWKGPEATGMERGKWRTCIVLTAPLQSRKNAVAAVSIPTRSTLYVLVAVSEE
jgi:hypothetical protein